MNLARAEAVLTVVSSVSRRAFCAGVVAGALLFAPARRAAADDLPIALQAELVTRLASYDKNMAARAGERVNILIVVKADNSDSQHAAVQLTSALGRFDRIGALPLGVQTVSYVDAPKLTALVKSGRLSLVFVMPQLGSEVEAIAAALDNVDVLTIAPSADMTRRGIVLGFELVSSRPKLFINLPQAEKQNVSMPAEVLKLTTVYR